MRLRLVAAAAVMTVFGCSCAGAPAYRYQIRDGGFALHNGPGYFNRPLFGTHEPSMLLGGDRPAFAFFAPTDAGKIGTLYLAAVTKQGGRWLHLLSDIDSVYRPGLMRYVLRDPSLAGGVLEVTAVPLAAAEGFTLQLRWIKEPASAARLVWAFGGASGYDVNKSARIDRLHLSPEDALFNAVRTWGDRFSLTSPTMKSKTVWGACDLPGRFEIKDAGQVLAGPAEAEAAGPSSAPVVLFAGEWARTSDPIHLLFVMAKAPELDRPAERFGDSVRHYRLLAKRVRVKTPDPHFDLAVEAMVVANDGLWQPPIFLHGAMSWMQPYLGWRGWYGSDAFGWHDRVRASIAAHASRQIQRGENRGAIPHMIGASTVSYNMNEVFLDQIYYHYGWTGDRKHLASMYPVIEGILSWEKRRLDPDNNGLYENCLNTWISDSHWYSGGDSTQASAYMYRAHRLAAQAAEAAGKDPKPWLAEAERILAAVNTRLWLPSRGHYAEFIDLIGLKRVHPEPELPTIYHPIEFGLADPFQAYQMLRFTETSLRNETDIAGGGRLVWSSNWKPNYDDTYTHSTNDLIFGEVLNLALAYYHADQFEKAYTLVKGIYAGMYMGGIPGGLSCVAYRSGQQRRNEEFSDPISLFAKLAVDGVFGIRPEMQRDTVHLTPGLPREWKEASIHTPDLEYTFRRQTAVIDLDVRTVRPTIIHFRVPVIADRVAGVMLNGVKTEYRLEPGVGMSFVEATGPKGTRTRLNIRLVPHTVDLDFRPVVTPGEDLFVRVIGEPGRKWKDPQRVLERARLSTEGFSGLVKDAPGHHTIFLETGDENQVTWRPIDFEIRPAIRVGKTEPDFQTGICRFVLENNTATALNASAQAIWLGRKTDLAVSIPASSSRTFTAVGDVTSLLPGKNRLQVRGLAAPVSTDILCWPNAAGQLPRDWYLLDLRPFYNDALPTILSHSFWTQDYPYAVCCDYMLDHLIGARSFVPDDRRLRAGVDARGVYVTRSGIPFAQRARGNNVVALSRWRDFPPAIDIPVGQYARKLYLMLTAITFPMQSHIANVRVTVNYTDGSASALDLVNPENFDNGWGGFGGTFHYAANGMESIGGAQPAPPDHIDAPMILSQHGMVDLTPHVMWEAGWGKSPNTRAPMAPHADIVDVDCDARRAIRSVRVDVLSNEIIVALLGTTLVR